MHEIRYGSPCNQRNLDILTYCNLAMMVILDVINMNDTVRPGDKTIHIHGEMRLCNVSYWYLYYEHVDKLV